MKDNGRYNGIGSYDKETCYDTYNENLNESPRVHMINSKK
ncbi:hypothetical protein ES703_03126 [subsurface metagenome]